MAVAELSVSRREVLGAACAAALARHSRESGNPDRSGEESWTPDHVRGDEGGDLRAEKWGRALARFRAVEAAVAAAEGAEGAEDEVFDPLVGRFNRVLTFLLRAPAPDVAALAVKLDLLVAHQAWELDFAEASLTAMRRDAVRLAGEGK